MIRQKIQGEKKAKGEEEEKMFIQSKYDIDRMPREEDFVALDVETTGFSPVLNELIEISAIQYHGREKINTFTTLVKPKAPIPYNITQLTGIDNEMVKNAKPIEEIMPELIKFIGHNIIVAHNAGFDVSFLQSYSHNSFSKNKIVDTVKLSRIMHPELINHKLGTVARYMGIKEDGFHRAEFDCECCARIYMKYIGIL